MALDSRMEHWVDKQRIKPTVLVMSQRGAKIRLNVLDPTGNVATDLACDGDNFQLVDYNKNCQLGGTCTRDSIAQLLRVSLEPDDFLLLAIGGVPIIDSPTGSTEWDSKKQHEILNLVSSDGAWKQRLILDGREQRWDVLSSTVWNAKGEVEWRLTNKGFTEDKGEDGKQFRVPARTRFEQPHVKAELAIRWNKRDINPTLDGSKFTITGIPPLQQCR